MQLKCRKCGNIGLQHADSSWQCPRCSAAYPEVRGIARFVDAEIYSSSFGFQWNRFAKTQLDSANGTTRSKETFAEKTGWTLGQLRGKRVLDAGCGMGRFAEVCADAGAEVHAIDLSSAVEAAQSNVGQRPNVRVYQADIMNLPFADGSFDFIYSIGVLHHTPDTRKAFLRLAPLLKEGGEIAIWVYSTRLKVMIGSTVLRPVTSRLPKPWLLRASWLAIPGHYLYRVPLVGRVAQVLLPLSNHPDPEWRWLDTFDWYSPRYQWKHSAEEVQDWFRESGLTDIQTGPFPVSVRGTRVASKT